jgi:hypothetical protein
LTLFHLVDQPLLTDCLDWLLSLLEVSHSPVNPVVIAAPSLASVAPSSSAAAENTAAAAQSASSAASVASSEAGLQVLMLMTMAGQSLTGVE